MALTTKATYTAFESGVTGPKLTVTTFVDDALAILTQAQFDAMINELSKIATIKHVSPFTADTSGSIVVMYEGADLGSGTNYAGVGLNYGRSFNEDGGIDLAALTP